MTSTHRDLVVFDLESQRCALPASEVLEVQRAVALTSLPGAPAIVEGLIDLRGKLVPVLDVRARLGLSPSPLAPSDHLIFARLAVDGGGERTVALRVDRALDLVRVADDQIEDPRAAAGTGQARGIARLAGGLVLIHDLPTFLSLDEAQQLDRALPARPG